MFRVTTHRLAYLLLLTGSSWTLAQELKLPDTPEQMHIAPPPSDRFPAKWYLSVGDGTDVVPAPVLDRPFTAAVETVTPYQSPIGENLQHITKGFQARDRLGRLRRDSENGAMTVEGQMVKTKVVLVSDPVSHCEFQWTQLTTDVEMPPDMRVAFVTCGPQTLRYKDLDLFASLLDTGNDGTNTRGDTTTKIEHLVPLQIDGLTVIRRRVSNTRLDEHGQVKKWAAETWYSPELREVFRLGTEEDGYEGLTEIRRKDPDPNLFYPPNGYRIELKTTS